MPRLQLFEFLDQSWLPARLRAALTGYLTASYAATRFPAIWAGIVARILEECGLDRIIDLGSGSGGPMELVLVEIAKLGRKPLVTLTDLHPVRTASSIAYWPTPVSATCVPGELHGLRTLFLVFHHLAPPTARAVLQDAFTQRQPICIFEATSRTASALAVSFVIPLLVLLYTPSIRPLSLFQILFTYLIPVLPVIIFWDGMVSHLRTYSTAELRELTGNYRSPEYVWEYGFVEASGVPYKMDYLIGRPAKLAV